MLEVFIVVDSGTTLKTSKVNTYTNTGYRIYPIGVPLPIIEKGKGSRGIGIIEKVIQTLNTTTIEFKIIEDTPNDSYYNLYRLMSTSNKSASNTENIFENTDQVIPGLYTKSSSSNEDNSMYYDNIFEDDDDYNDDNLDLDEFDKVIRERNRKSGRELPNFKRTNKARR